MIKIDEIYHTIHYLDRHVGLSPPRDDKMGDKLVAMRTLVLLMIFIFCGNANAQTGAFNDQKANLQINDVYAFNSYEAARDGFVTIIANFAQTPTSEFAEVFFDPNASYEINIDSDGNGIENQSYRFRFKQRLKEDIETVAVGDENISVPFLSSGNIQVDNGNVFKDRSFTIELIRKKPSYIYRTKGPNRKNTGKKLRIANTKTTEFAIPENLIDANSFTDYDSYADDFVYDLDLRFGKCDETARVFVGQRKASFQGNLTGIKNNFDFDFLGSNGAVSSTADSSVLSIALELPKSCLDLPKVNSTIGVWASIHSPARAIVKSNGIFGKPNLNSLLDFVQVDRMAHPFVNDFLIGYDQKVNHLQRRPKNDDKNFSDYFEYPALAELIEANTSFTAPNNLPREDLAEFYLDGLEAINQFTENNKAKNQRSFEALRLNTTTTAVTAASQNTLGVLGSDNAGYPNGRRPGDDVVDIFFRALMGFFVDLADAPDKNTAFSDGVDLSASDFGDAFPYLVSP